MKRKLIRQMWSERRSNLWLVVELTLVSALVWAIIANITPQLEARMRPVGVDTEGAYKLELTTVGPDSPYFNAPAPGDSLPSAAVEPLRILSALRLMPEVEAAASGTAHVYTFSSQNTGIAPADSVLAVPMQEGVAVWTVSPDYFKVFKTPGLRGESPEALGNVLAEGRVILTEDVTRFKPDGYGKPENLYNLDVNIDGYGIMNTGAVIGPLRRSETESGDYPSVILPAADEELLGATEWFRRGSIFVRKRPQVSDAEFRSLIDSYNLTLQTTGNTYISRCTPFSELRRDVQKYAGVELRNVLVVMSMLLVTVFLGVLGSFWFRTQGRVRELAIRKVVGARSGNIIARLVCEGLLLVLAALPFALALDLLMLDKGFSASAYTWPWAKWSCFAGEVAAATALMCVIVILGTWFPARRAMRVDPAETLRSE